jgi:hypothetical protein
MYESETDMSSDEGTHFFRNGPRRKKTSAKTKKSKSKAIEKRLKVKAKKTDEDSRKRIFKKVIKDIKAVRKDGAEAGLAKKIRKKKAKNCTKKNMCNRK